MNATCDECNAYFSVFGDKNVHTHKFSQFFRQKCVTSIWKTYLVITNKSKIQSVSIRNEFAIVETILHRIGAFFRMHNKFSLCWICAFVLHIIHFVPAFRIRQSNTMWFHVFWSRIETSECMIGARAPLAHERATEEIKCRIETRFSNAKHHWIVFIFHNDQARAQPFYAPSFMYTHTKCHIHKFIQYFQFAVSSFHKVLCFDFFFFYPLRLPSLCGVSCSFMHAFSSVEVTHIAICISHKMTIKSLVVL